MADQYHVKLAQVLTHFSLRVKPKDYVILLSPTLAEPLLKELVREITRAGAHVQTELQLGSLNEIVAKEANEDQLSWMPPHIIQMIESADCLLSIGGTNNTKQLQSVDPKKLALRGKTMGKMTETIMRRGAEKSLRWCVTQFPTEANAQEAGMSLEDWSHFIYQACLLNEPDPVAAWQKVESEQQRYVDYLSDKDVIHITAPDTDVTYRVKGRTWLNAAGQVNLPDGEVFTGPIEDSVNGHVRFSYPAIRGGNVVEDIRLTIENGKVVNGTAKSGQEFLDAMLNMDDGARYFGEVAFGLNYAITKFSKNILFDEKIGGTMHMAVGASYPDSGGKNQSALHWDMISDLSQARATADGELFYENGRFVI